MSLELIMNYYLTYLAITVRMVAFLNFVPALGGQRIPVFLRVAVALMLALVVLPVAAVHPVQPQSPVDLALVMGKEFAIGAVLGFMVELVFMLARVFGHVADVELGLGMTQLIDPQFGSVPLSGQLFYLAVVAGWLALNGHHSLLKGIVGSYQVLPLESTVFRPELVTHFVDVFAQLFTAALRIGLPFLAAMFLATVALGVLARAMPQLNLLIVGLPAKLLVGTFMLAIMFPAILTGFVRMTGMVTDELYQLFNLLHV